MITKEFGKYYGACDLCDEETPGFETWHQCRAYISANGWQAIKDQDSGEWAHYCPDCARKINNKQI